MGNDLIQPPFLKNGDTIGIAAISRSVTQQDMLPFVALAQKHGYRVQYAPNLFQQDNVFAGTIEDRVNGLQALIDDDAVQCIIFARGGYGAIQVVDKLNFDILKLKPKWFIGYSDLTAILCHLNSVINIQTLHGTMAWCKEDWADDAKENYNNNIQKVFKILGGNIPYYTEKGSIFNKTGFTEGILLGGNLAMLTNLIGTLSMPVFKGSILFIEDIDEYLYNIERMLYHLKRHGILDQIKGLVVGAFTNTKDNPEPFGKNVYEIVLNLTNEYQYPIVFDFPAGHDALNYPLILGANVQLEVLSNEVKLHFKAANE